MEYTKAELEKMMQKCGGDLASQDVQNWQSYPII